MRAIFRGYSEILLFFTLFSTVACNKTLDDRDISVEMRSWITYDLGTYWLFKDSATNLVDSIVPTHGIYQNATTEDKQYRYQHGGISLYEYSADSNLINAAFGINVDATANENTSQLLYKNKIGQIGYDPFIITPGIHGGQNSTYGYRDQILTVSFLGQFSLLGNTFDSVFQFTYTFPNTDLKEFFFINRKIGFIKIVQNNAIIKRTLLLQKWYVLHK